MKRIILTLTIIYLSIAAYAAPQLKPELQQKIERGQVIAQSLPAPEGSQIKIGKAMGIAEGSPKELVHMLMDIKRYKHYFPRVKDSRFVKKIGKDVFGVIETTLPWPLKDAWVYVKISYKAKANDVYEMNWVMQNGTLKTYQGYILIQPWDTHKNKCLVTYKTIVEPKTIASNDMISKGTKRGAELIMHRIRIRIKALKKFKAFPKDLDALYP